MGECRLNLLSQCGQVKQLAAAHGVLCGPEPAQDIIEIF